MRHIVHSVLLLLFLQFPVAFANPGFEGARGYGNTETILDYHQLPLVKPGEPEPSCMALFARVRNPVTEQRIILSKIVPSEQKTTAEFLSWYNLNFGKIENALLTDDLPNESSLPSDFLRFVRLPDYANSPSVKSGVELYGIENFIAWKKADDKLKSIPIGELEITVDLLKEVNRISIAKAHPFMNRFQNVLPAGYVPSKPGTIKMRTSYGANPIKNPLTEAEYEVVKNNPWLGGFQELPLGFSKPGARRGWIKYGSGEDAEKKLQELIDWYNANRKTMDPVELAARFQYAMVSIHPFTDGNGRTSRLLMDRILREHNLPPSILGDSDRDILVPIEEYIAEVRSGLIRYAKINAMRNQPSLTNFKNSRLESIPKVTESQIKETTEFHGFKPISVGGHRFTISLSDGFLYSDKGIPHVYREGKLYPISDRSYRLLEMAGRKNIKERNMTTPSDTLLDKQGDVLHQEPGIEKIIKSFEVVPGDEQTKYVQANIEFINKINRKELEQKNVQLVSYDHIEKANRNRNLMLYDWQEELFRSAIHNISDDPKLNLLVLNPNKTEFGKRVASLKEIDPMNILAQYELTDMYLADLENTAATTFPKLQSALRDRRKRAFLDAKALMRKFDQDFQTLSSEAKEIYNRSNEVKVYNQYLSYSKLSQNSFEEGVSKLGDDSVYLMRSDSSQVSKIGFKSHAHFKKVFDSLPMSDKLQNLLERVNAFLQSQEGNKKIRKILSEIKKNAEDEKNLYKYFPEPILAILRDLEKYYQNVRHILNYCVHTVFKNRYDMHAAGPEFERAMVMDLLHAGGKGFKASKSFTTNPSLMTHFPFANQVTGLWDPQISFVKVPRDAAYIQLGSDGYSFEYEILVEKSLKPTTIKAKLLPKDLPQFDPRQYSTEAVKEISDFVAKYKLPFRSVTGQNYIKPKRVLEQKIDGAAPRR
jgi:hypothetical protein